VYVQEVPSGVRTIAGVSTSVALFVGFTRSGPVNTPIRCTTYSDYVARFGEDVTAGEMTPQVKLFFQNGGTQCYVLRVAEGFASSQITLRAEDAATAVLTLTAASPGVSGDLIRAAVSYNGTQPEDTFNLELFRWEPMPNGTLVRQAGEIWRGLSMDPGSGAFAPAVLNASSKLVTAAVAGGAVAQGTSSTGSHIFTAGAEVPELTALLAAGRNVQVSVDGSRFVNVELPPASATFTVDVVTQINSAFTTAGLPVPVGLSASFVVSGTHSWLRLAVTAGNGNIFVRRATTGDAAAALGLGSEQGGIEVTRFAHRRPAATGVVTDIDLSFFANLVDGAPAGNATITLNKYDRNGALAPVDVTATWSTDSLPEILAAVRTAIVNGPAPSAAPSSSTLGPGERWPWTGELWGHRLAILPTNGPGPAGSDDNRPPGFAYAGDGAATIGTTENVRHYSLGVTGAGAHQTGGVPGADGTAPLTAAIYDAAYAIARSEVDLFNLLVLPRSIGAGVPLEDLWSNASIFCEEERALLLMEAPRAWSGASEPASDVATLRVGLSKQYAALYYPRLTVLEGRTKVDVGPTGAMAGLMARIDSARGVWKAPAGTEADLRGIVGLSELFSDRENGLMNPRAINVIRAFPNGIVSWGARTMDGDDDASSEYKYVPVRRLALYIEESLYRGLKWVVFEPNADPLWAQIRLNVGAFMQGLFRQGAFQGTTRQQAYFVKCDAETTTQNDRNLGIVNVWVGFAPLKPAEFVILSLQQMAGQLEV
jgi:phage tail sheath protein FI